MRRPPKAQSPERAAALKLWVVLSRAHEAVSEWARRNIEKSELSYTEFGVLEVLYHKGDLTAGEVSRRVLLRSGSLTYVIDKLASRGLLARRSCAEDRRRIYLQLTPSGRAIIRKIWPGHAAAIEQATAGLTLSEKEAVTESLKRLGLLAELTAPREPTRGDKA